MFASKNTGSLSTHYILAAWSEFYCSAPFLLVIYFLQLSVHPVEESQIQFIENHAFMHFKDQDSGSGSSQSQANRSIVTALYAEVIGVLAMTRFQSVRRRFVQEYKDNQHSSRALVNIIMGLKFIRIKVNSALGSDLTNRWS